MIRMYRIAALPKIQQVKTPIKVTTTYGHVKHHFQDYDAAFTNIEADDQGRTTAARWFY